MIYGNMILENQLEKLTDHANIIQEYYENEVSFLNSIIEYQDKSLITESTDLQVLQEGFAENIAKKIKELIDKFLNWLKTLWSKFTELFKKKINSEDDKIKNAEKKMKDIDNDDTLSKEQKETKKANIVKYLINSNDNNTASDKDDDKPKSFRERYTFITHNVSPDVFNLLLSESKYIERIVKRLIRLSKFDIEALNELLLDLASKDSIISYDELWKEYEKEYSGKQYYDKPEDVLKRYKQNIENYERTKTKLEYYKNDIEKTIAKLKTQLNHIDTDQETLKLRYSIINKLTSITQTEISNAVKFVAALSGKVKLQVIKN